MSSIPIANLPRRITGLMALTATSLAAQAQPNNPAELETLVYVGTRTPLPLEKSSPSVSVFTSDTATIRQWDSLIDVLNGMPGMHVAKSGHEGSTASLFSRGTNSDHTTLLLNGRRLNPGFSGFYSLGQIPLTGNTQVEVLRGATSALYGAEGIGGVINLRTDQHSTGIGSSGLARMEAGSFDTINGAISQQISRETWRGNVAISRQGTNNDLPNHRFKKCTPQTHLEADLATGLAADLQVFAYDSSIGLPGNRKSVGYPQMQDFQDDTLWMVSPGITYQITPGSQIKAFVAHSENNLRGKTSGSFGVALNDFRTATTQFDLQWDLQTSPTLLWSGGLGYQNVDFHQTDLQVAPGSPPLTDNRWQSWSAFLQAQWEPVASLRATAAIRVDDYSAFDSPWTGHGELAFSPGKGPLKLFTKVARGYAIPQAFDIFGTFGNPDLNAEESDSVEAGLRLIPAQLPWHLSIVAFQNDLKNLIVFTPQFTTDNIGQARTRGLEFSLQGTVGQRVRYWVQSTHLEAVNLDQQTRLARRPTHTAQLGAQWSPHRSLSLATEIAWIAGREDIDGSTFMTVDMHDYTVVRLAGHYEIPQTPLTVTIRIENFLDRSYDTVDGFAAPSRAAYLGLATRW